MTATHWILLPGFDGTGLLFAPLIAAIPKDIPVTTISYPTGASQSYEDLVKMVLDALPTDAPYALIAESFSGPVAIRVATAAPRPPVALVLCATFAECPVGTTLRLVLQIVGKFMFRVRPPEFMVRYFLLGADAPLELIRLFDQAQAAVPAPVLAARLRSVLQANVMSALSQVAAPVLYIGASQDRIVGPHCARVIQNWCPQACVEAVQSPHLILQRQPEQCVRLIQAFVAKADGR